MRQQRSVRKKGGKVIGVEKMNQKNSGDSM